MEDFNRLIYKLILKRYEGAYWDFKQQHHLNTADLLHDIICMANNVEYRDAYIIFGVTDRGKIVGVNDDAKRRNQEHFISFLRDKQFEAGYRPIVELRIMEIDKFNVDILIIKKSNRTPFYLTKDHRDGKKTVRSYHIYSRIQDTNTPKDQSADERVVEDLWKRRFGLLPEPIDRLRFALKDKQNWTHENNVSYYNPLPEFTIERIDDEYDYKRQNKEFYSYNQTNTSTSYESIECKYYMTTLFTCQSVTLDGGRYSTPIANWGFISIDKYGKETLTYKYYICNSLKYDLNLFLYDKENDDAKIARGKYIELILLFKSNNEKEEFESFVRMNINYITGELNKRIKEKLVFENLNEHEKRIENKRLHTGFFLNEVLKKYREDKIQNKGDHS